MTVHLIEGSGTIHRYFHIFRNMARMKDNHPTGAIYGAASSYWSICKAEPDYVAICYDGKRGSQTRRDVFPAYKSNRKQQEPDLSCQWDGVRACADAFSIPKVQVDTAEADDLVATLTRVAREAGHEVMIISNDKDFAQLVGDGVMQFDPKDKRMIGPDDIQAKWGVRPDQMIDLQALMGDATDGVPGVPGVGIKTAVALLTQFDTLDNLLANTREIKNDKLRYKIEDNHTAALTSRKLVTLDQTIPLNLTPEDLAYKGFDLTAVTTFMETWGFITLAAEIERAMKTRNYELEPAYF
jgi:DNA polymerase-1